ncbi:unnamed protein product [Polarella glacialis]|uniref:Uncharacterized protein n=1 Tax=Polarella glacialis TaxID=89957 RepID=A0A813LYB0_POLGL|nr:unnamed protein product [Polarella glacialis]
MWRQLDSAWRCGGYGTGVVVMLTLYGIIQERIMSEAYDGEFFTSSAFLVFCNRIFGIAFAVGMMMASKESFQNKAPLWKYLLISSSNVLSTWSQYEALKHVSFPVQMLGKSFKMLPVMLWGILISHKRYGWNDWATASSVTWGVTQFLVTGEILSKHADEGSGFYGLCLLFVFLLGDGFTSTFQEKLFKEHTMSKYNQMLYVNSWSAVISAIVLAGADPRPISFCLGHQLAAAHICLLSLAAVAGQFFIYSEVKEFGALVLAMTMNLRQVVSILVSYAIYFHPVNLMQILSLAIIFGSLFLKNYSGLKKSRDREEDAKASPAKSDELRELRPTEIGWEGPCIQVEPAEV